MENNWTKVYTTENAYTAEILKQGLIEANIPAIVLNKQDSSYGTFGVIHVLVHPDDFGKATAYISENEI